MAIGPLCWSAAAGESVMAGPGNSPRWRVFVSHTSELRDYPDGGSYIAAVERAVSAEGHVIVDMADFAAMDQAPAQLCVEKVTGCEVYVGVLGMRYGSPVRDRTEVSYTELEFDTASKAGMDRLVFLMDPDADDLRIPAKALVDREYGSRQDVFRRRVEGSELVAKRFGSPDELEMLVERSLRTLADTRARIDTEIKHERMPTEPSPVWASKFVNSPPMTAPTWFQDRHVETRLVAEFLADPGMRLMTVVGRGGIGKTAMVCRLLKGLDAGRIPGVDGDLAELVVKGIVPLSPNGLHLVDYPNLVADLCRLLPAEAAKSVQCLYEDPHNSPGHVMAALLEAFASGAPVVVFLDNLESVMDTGAESLTDPGLNEALETVLRAPEHAVKVIITTRVAPTRLQHVEPAVQHQLRLDEGLGSPDAEHVLRCLDSDGHLGLRDAPDALLGAVREATRGFPRALVAVKSILETNVTRTVADVLDRIHGVGEDEIVEVLIGDAYEHLDQPAQRVMQALAVYPTPVPAVGVDVLLRPFNATVDAAPILDRLVRAELVRHDARQYYLQPIDRAYARGRIPAGEPGDTLPAFTLAALQALAADYYVQIRTPAQTWRSLDDVRPQLAEFDLRAEVGDFDTAASVLAGIDYDYLQVWGHYRMLIDLHMRIHDQITDQGLQTGHLASLGLCYFALADYTRAIGLHQEALAIARQIGDRGSEAAELGNLGNCDFRLGDYQKAIGRFQDASAIFSELGDRQGEATELGSLGSCHSRRGEYPAAIDLHQKALVIARELGDRQGEATDLGNLGVCHFRLGGYPAAIDLHQEALVIARELGDRQGEATDLGSLGIYSFRLGDYPNAIALFQEALGIARDIGDRQVEANVLTNLGNAHLSLGDYPKASDLQGDARLIASEIGDPYLQATTALYLARVHLAGGDPGRAVALFEEAIGVADATGDTEPGVQARSGLARAQLQAGTPAAALSLTGAARQMNYPTEQATLWLLEGIALLAMGRAGARDAFGQALQAADTLLALADANVAALDARALACCGLVLTGDPARAAQAAQTFARARTVTAAAGVVAEVARLFAVLASGDHAGVLAPYRDGLQQILGQ